MDKYFELKALASHLTQQLLNNSEEDRIEICEMVKTHFPQFLYQGKGYRYRYLTSRAFSPNPYKSYAKTISGAKTFIENEKNAFKLTEETPLELIEAEIIGVDLTLVAKHLVYLSLLDDSDLKVFYSEEEIIAVDVLNYIVR